MSLTLLPETERRITDHLRTGRFTTADELVLNALSLLEQDARDREAVLASVRRKIKAGAEQLDRGEGLDGDRVFTELLAGLEGNESGTRGG